MTTTPARPFRFGYTGGASSKREKLLSSARVTDTPAAPIDARPEVMAPVVERLAGT